MIPTANITAWRHQAPWPEDNQVEQDLVLSRLMIEIANADMLADELALRGGTCLHKLHLPTPLRYSEDLDYVRRSKSGVGPVLDAIRAVVTGIGLEDRGTEFRGPMVHAKFDADPTSGVGRIRVKIEINVAETVAVLPRATLPFHIDSPWWRGGAEISTFAIEELTGTKLRALYQRNKGRDLFDLWLVLGTLNPDAERIASAFHHYMGSEAFTFPELSRNLSAKLDDGDFVADVRQLARVMPHGYTATAAADLVMERLGPHLRNAPGSDEIRDGAWRLES